MTFAHAVGGTMSEHAPSKERARMTSHGDPRGQVADDVIDDSDRCANSVCVGYQSTRHKRAHNKATNRNFFICTPVR